MSATHSMLGAAGRNWRWTRSSATRTPGTRIVVRPRRLGISPARPACAHQPLDPFAPDPDPVSHPQLGMHPRRAIDPPVL